MSPLRAALLASPLLAIACAGPGAHPLYPLAPRGEVVDDYHGTLVPDPYRWLESSETPQVRRWIDAQNRLTRAHLDAIPGRDAVRTVLERLSAVERYGMPSQHGRRYYFSYNDGVMGQAQLVRAETPGADIADCHVILDPNTWSDDGTISLGGTSFSPSGRYLAYGQSDGGSDWRTWRVRDLDTGRDLPDVIQWSRFSRPSWKHDDSGFYYLRFPESDNRLIEKDLRPSLYYHGLGTLQEEDVLTYEDPRNLDRSFGISVTEDDGRFEVLFQRRGTTRKNWLWFRETASGASGEWVRTFDAFDATYLPLGNDGWDFWIWTDKGAPRGRIVKVDCSAPGNEWSEVVPEREHTLTSAAMIGGRLVCHYLVDARSEVVVFETGGATVEKLELPGAGSVSGLSGRQRKAETFLTYSSFAAPGITYRYDVQASQLEEVRRASLDVDVDRYVAKQVFFESRDGTRVPLFIVHARGVALDGSNPTLLYGYGGFNIAMRPRFSPYGTAWLELGGVYAVCCMRGGGEYGREWYRAGTLDRKQNVFDDFIGAAEHLVELGYTSPGRIAIQGGSNGGLLVGACVNQRPDLYGAALPAVGVMDMLRYHEWTIGVAWASDYGLSSDPEMFPHLLAYSPVHNATPGTEYPAVLVTTGDHDDRVVPYHSFKYAAAMQHAQAGEAPVLIRIETRAGHGAGKSREQRVEEMTDQFSFLIQHLGVEVD